MEKSLLSFAKTYPTWEPDSAAKQMLATLSPLPPQPSAHYPYTTLVPDAGAQFLAGVLPCTQLQKLYNK
jgi:hypothetical protein